MSEIKKVKINDAVHEGLKSESAHKEHVAEINHIAIEDYNVNESVQQSYKSLIEYMLSTEYIENLIEITSTTNSSESTGDAVIDLTGTEYENLEGFDQHIIDIVNNVGPGTREAVVAVMLALADYTLASGKRIKYLYGYDQGRQDPYNPTLGIQQESHPENGFGMDCSGVIVWALTKAGYNFTDIKTGEPIVVQTDYIYEWARENGYVLNTIEGGKPGDLLVTKGRGHIAMVVGTYEDENGGGYYIAEETESIDTNGEIQNGYRIFKRSYDYLASEEKNYATIDMTDFYNTPANIRNNTYGDSQTSTINRVEETQ